MAFLTVIGVSIAIGAFAQKVKGRTGALWGFITFILGVILWYYAEIAVKTMEEPVEPFVISIMLFILTGGIMALIVATLPNKK